MKIINMILLLVVFFFVRNKIKTIHIIKKHSGMDIFCYYISTILMYLSVCTLKLTIYGLSHYLWEKSIYFYKKANYPKEDLDRYPSLREAVEQYDNYQEYKNSWR